MFFGSLNCPLSDEFGVLFFFSSLSSPLQVDVSVRGSFVLFSQLSASTPSSFRSASSISFPFSVAPVTSGSPTSSQPRSNPSDRSQLLAPAADRSHSPRSFGLLAPAPDRSPSLSSRLPLQHPNRSPSPSFRSPGSSS